MLLTRTVLTFQDTNSLLCYKIKQFFNTYVHTYILYYDFKTFGITLKIRFNLMKKTRFSFSSLNYNIMLIVIKKTKWSPYESFSKPMPQTVLVLKIFHIVQVEELAFGNEGWHHRQQASNASLWYIRKTWTGFESRPQQSVEDSCTRNQRAETEIKT